MVHTGCDYHAVETFCRDCGNEPSPLGIERPVAGHAHPLQRLGAEAEPGGGRSPCRRDPPSLSAAGNQGAVAAVHQYDKSIHPIAPPGAHPAVAASLFFYPRFAIEVDCI